MEEQTQTDKKGEERSERMHSDPRIAIERGGGDDVDTQSNGRGHSGDSGGPRTARLRSSACRAISITQRGVLSITR